MESVRGLELQSELGSNPGSVGESETESVRGLELESVRVSELEPIRGTDH